MPVAPALSIIALLLGLAPRSFLGPAQRCSVLSLLALLSRPSCTPISSSIGAPILPLPRASCLALVALLLIDEGLKALKEVKAGLPFGPRDQVFHGFDLMIKVSNALFVLSPECLAKALQPIQEIIAASNHAISTHSPQRRWKRPSPLTHRRWPLFAQSTLAKQKPQCLPAFGTKSAPPRFGPSEAPVLDLNSLEGEEVTKQPAELGQQRSPFLGPRWPPRRNSLPQASPAQAKPAHPTRGLPPWRLVQVARRLSLRLGAQEEAAGSHANHEGVEQKDAPIIHKDLGEVVPPGVPSPGIRVEALLDEIIPPVVDPMQRGEGVVEVILRRGPTAAKDHEEQGQESFAPLPGSSSPGAPVGGPLMRPVVP